jgi:hypothetical protein
VVARAACLADCVHRCCGQGIGFLLACAIVSFPLAILALVPLGALYLQVFGAAQTTSPNLEAFATGEGTVDVTAHVVREGIARDSPYGGTQELVRRRDRAAFGKGSRSECIGRRQADNLQQASRRGRSPRCGR